MNKGLGRGLDSLFGDIGVKDIDKSYNSGGLSCSNPFLTGTSFASPYKLMEDLSA